ncbi:magnesium transporter CorA family protein [Kitasatospora sp. MAP5-34]|uniref:magnesium transporter CorA family protein n=1 Tax=Kitasatospora sp. MAP5-34 TaxID=3035102 RepID=UPI002476994E|nr:magnesium transporter CorA family protein [Kitasatospora sp. MAP5-34]
MSRTRLYRSGNLVLEDFPVEDISEYVSDPSAVVWLDLCAPGPKDLAMIGEEFGLHELAVEDARNEHQRPKLDCYRTHSFMSAYAVGTDRETGMLTTSEISVFITSTALITVRADDSFDIEQVVARWDDTPDLVKHGVGFLLYGLLDFIVDGHFAAVQELDDRIEEVEDILFDEDSSAIQSIQRRSFELRKNLVRVRRVVLPMREVVNTLLRRDLHIVNEPLTPYYQDVYDHVLRATEWTESLRDMITSIMETNLTIQSNRMNLIMKKVTSWAAIIAVPTAVTGFYGQNVPFPGFAAEWGLVASSTAIVVLSVVLYVSFKRKDWI